LNLSVFCLLTDDSMSIALVKAAPARQPSSAI